MPSKTGQTSIITGDQFQKASAAIADGQSGARRENKELAVVETGKKARNKRKRDKKKLKKKGDHSEQGAETDAMGQQWWSSDQSASGSPGCTLHHTGWEESTYQRSLLFDL